MEINYLFILYDFHIKKSFYIHSLHCHERSNFRNSYERMLNLFERDRMVRIAYFTSTWYLQFPNFIRIFFLQWKWCIFNGVNELRANLDSLKRFIVNTNNVLSGEFFPQFSIFEVVFSKEPIICTSGARQESCHWKRIRNSTLALDIV